MSILFELSNCCSNEIIDIMPENNEEEILGGILLNRIAGIAYDKINFDTINKESKKMLSVIKEYYDLQFDIFIDKLKYVSSLFEKAEFKHAFLKGAFLTPVLYKRGQRISNDIDILVEPLDTTNVSNLLVSNGFVQGHCNKNGEIVPATRREIIESKMNFGETVPFFKYYNGNLIEIDINFSLDFKAKGSGNAVKEILNTSDYVDVGNGIKICTLSRLDFLIHLCCHLFKEATTYDWVKYRRDLMLYKFSDINVYLHQFGDSDLFAQLSKRILELGAEKECYYVLKNSSIIYPDLNGLSGFKYFVDSIKPISTEYMNQIIAPRQKEIFFYNISFIDWFESPNRLSQLQKIKNI